MEIYLDTSDISAVERLYRILPLAGVTTNPVSLPKVKERTLYHLNLFYALSAMQWTIRFVFLCKFWPIMRKI